MQSLEKNWLVVSNNDMKDLVNFHPTTQKSKCFISMGYKYIRFQLKKYRGVIFRDTMQWCKSWINPEKFEKLYIDGLFLFKEYVSVGKF